MKVINSLGFPQAFVSACERELLAYDKVGWRSVTTLNDSPRICMLRERHEKEVVVDVKDMMWLLLGQVIHKILEDNGNPTSIVEQRILVPFMGKEISMKADHIDPIPDTSPQAFTVQDYKITGVYAFQHGVSKSQEAQNNLYRWGYRKQGINCTKGELEMFLKDFSAFDAKINPHNYPKAEVVRVPVMDWTDDKCEAYLTNRIKIFMHAEICSDADLPECSINERWGTPDVFAVKAIKDGKIADKASPGASKFETKLEAEQWIATKKSNTQYTIEFRKGENRRCERNACWCSKWCNQFNTQISPDF